MTRVCAFCGNENTTLTREHVFPYGLISKFPEHEYAIFDNKKAIKLSPEKQVVKDVCSTCNNTHLSTLDNYGNSFILKYFKNTLSVNQLVEVDYDYKSLSKWVMKILYNSLRKDPSNEWLRKNSTYMISQTENTSSKFSLFLGTYVYMAPFMNLFPDIPFQGLSNPIIALNTKNQGSPVDQYKNDNIEVIYLLRLCNAIFVLVCWKENRWSIENEKEISSILPHKLLVENENVAVINRATDCINTAHLPLVHTIQVQQEYDLYFQNLLNR